MSQKGTINVQTENIFPIIKKFLYSDHEIFLRELVSNAVDASRKLKALNSLGEFKGELGTLAVNVSIDKAAKTITVSDNGIGMTEEEVEKYITQVAFSGAEEFVQKYKDKTDVQGIIGHFGLGFYSAFMVAAKVELITKSYKDDSSAVKWSCDGSPNYTIEPAERSGRGTDIILHVADDSLEFLGEDRINGILTKYCKFLPVEIRFGEHEETIREAVKDEEGKETEPAVKQVVPTVINNPNPAWTKKPADLGDEDYKAFYRELYPMNFEDPLFWIHLNVDYPFNLTGILYFPRIKKSFEVQKDKIQLYCNQVFVTDNVGEIVPDFLTLLRGVIDSPDIPLNVSRSYLQSDSNVKKISTHITKKVADKLEELFKKDRADFEAKWEDIRIFVQYGMISDEKFYEKAQKFALLKNTEGKCFTIEEYREKVQAFQKDKDEKLILLYTNNADEQHSFIDAAKSRGYDVLVFDSMIDPHFINHLESKLEKTSFVRVDSDSVDKLIKKTEDLPSKLSDGEKEEIKKAIEVVLPAKTYHVTFESLLDTDAPMTVTRPEFMRRMKDMSALSGGSRTMFGDFPEMYNLVVNVNHPIAGKILGEKDEAKRGDLVKNVSDLALLAQGLLKGEELTKFIKRSNEQLSINKG